MSSQPKPLLIIFAPVVIVALGYIGFIWWERGAPPGFQPTAHEVSITEINRNHRGVRLHGMARHDVRITQRNPDDPDAPKHYLFPMMPIDNFNSKTIRVMVRTTKKPDKMATIEEMTVEGLARPPGRLVSRDVILNWQDKGYEFDEKFVLVLEFEE